MQIDSFLRSHGQMFKAYRDGKEFAELLGLQISNKNRKHIQFRPDTDILAGDSLISKITNEEFVVIEVETIVQQRKPFSKTAYYQTKAQYERTQLNKAIPNASQQIIINNQYGERSTFISDNASIAIDITTININYGISDLEALIKSKSQTPEEYAELLTVLKELSSKDQAPRGILSKFHDQINKHGWLAGAITNLLFSYFFGKPTIP